MLYIHAVTEKLPPPCYSEMEEISSGQNALLQKALPDFVGGARIDSERSKNQLSAIMEYPR